MAKILTALIWAAFIVFGSASKIKAAVSLVQTVTGSTGSIATNSWNVAIAPPQQGDTLIAIVAIHGSFTNGVSSINQTQLGWVCAGFAPNPGGIDTEIWYTTNPVASGAGYNISIQTTYAWRASAIVLEYSGLATNSSLDLIASGSEINTNIVDIKTTLTTANRELWLGAIGLNSSDFELATNSDGATQLGNQFQLITNAQSHSTTKSANSKVYASALTSPFNGIADLNAVLNTNAAWGGLIATFRERGTITTNLLAGSVSTFAGNHPRLFINSNIISIIKGEINTNRFCMNYWTNLTNYVNSKTNLPAWKQNNNSTDSGDIIADMAFIYLINEDSNVLKIAQQWATNICDYPDWSGSGGQTNYGIVYGDYLVGLAMLYDFAYTNLDLACRQTILTTLALRARQQYSAYTNDTMGPIFLSNQNMLPDCGLLSAALAICDSTNTLDWILCAEQNLENTAESLSPDGVHVEGAQYANYGESYLLESFALCRDLLGINLFTTATNWGSNNGLYYTDMYLPRNAWHFNGNFNALCQVPFESCKMRDNAYGHLLRGLAHYYKDTRAQWFADQLDIVDPGDNLNDNGIPSWSYLFWYDSSVLSTAPTNGATFDVFNNMGYISARSDWSGNENLLTFKCSGPAGAYLPLNYGGYFLSQPPIAMSAQDPGLFHVHPDANNFCFFGVNQQWLITEPGYLANRISAYENTMLVDGNGQYQVPGNLYATYIPLVTNVPSLTYYQTTPTIDTMIGEASSAYSDAQGVKKYSRHLIFLKPSTLIVADNIEMNDANHTNDLYFHFPNDSWLNIVTNYIATNTATVFVQKSLAKKYLDDSTNVTFLRLDWLTQNSKTTFIATNQTILLNGESRPYNFNLLDIRARNITNWQNVVAFTFSTNSVIIPPVKLLTTSEQDWTIAANGRVVDINWLPAPTTPTLLQYAIGENNISNSVTLSLTNLPADGNTLIAATLYRTGGSHNSSVDSIAQSGANWSQVIYTNGCGAFVTEIWYATNIQSASSNIVVNFIGSNPASVAIMEYHGLLSANSVDVKNGNGSASQETSVFTGANGVTAQTNELWISAVGLNSANSIFTSTNTYNKISSITNTAGFYVFENIATNSGSPNVGGTNSIKSSWNAVIATFKAVSSVNVGESIFAPQNYGNNAVYLPIKATADPSPQLKCEGGYNRRGTQIVRLSWSGAYKLQVKTNLQTGSWMDYSNGFASPVDVPLDVNASAVFFRLSPLN